MSPIWVNLTTESAFWVNRLIASKLLYGFTTTSADCVSGKTEYVWMSFFGNRSFIRSRIKLPSPEPVPPAMECRNMNPCIVSAAADRIPCPTESYLERITPVCFTIDHVEDFLLHHFTGGITRTPIVPRTNALLSDEEVFGVVDVLVRTGLNGVKDLDSGISARRSTKGLRVLGRNWHHTLGSKSSRMARGMYRVSSLCIR